MENSLPLNVFHIKKTQLVINRLHTFLHGITLLPLFYYRITSLTAIVKTWDKSTFFPQFLLLISELILSFIWLLAQPSKWKPVVRTVYPERLPGDEKLPSIDVFICTADPNKEPCLEVMNTVISALALDYPPDKLHVYLSDDGGCSVTFRATKQAWNFSNFWIPFCRKYEVKNRCPEAYFLREENSEYPGKCDGSEFLVDKKDIEERYEEFKNSLAKIAADTSAYMSKDHTSLIQVISDEHGNEIVSDKEEMPVLVYVAREKRPSHPHHFKAGALNVLLRVSAMISNSPYILVLDCDMYCNDPSSARQAMCFHLDSKLSPKLAFVQFPQQKFYNISETDIYDGQLRYIWVGFRYFAVVEDVFTGFNLHCDGWISVYIEPSRPCFLGASPITLSELLVQHMRWNVGLNQIAMSSFSPLLYGPLRMSISQSMCYAEFAHSPLYFLSLYILALIPQLCLLRGIPLYPQDMVEQQRIWMMKSLTSYLYATFDAIMEKVGLRTASFLPTNKVVDDEQAKRYQMGIYDFQVPALFMVPLCTLYILNVASLVIGFGRILHSQKGNEMVIQTFIPLFATVLHFPLFEGMVLRKDKGAISKSVSLVSALISTVVLFCASFVS
ncbi:hypothetical protein DH2020_004749 [Rehmannia glutinosa]|uniref:Cellulose synthase-like protein n=1 Tax=Rehmannia glutinosa TaxID=99300 RepID=A0ABR0XQK5_REHGL